MRPPLFRLRAVVLGFCAEDKPPPHEPLDWRGREPWAPGGVATLSPLLEVCVCVCRSHQPARLGEREHRLVRGGSRPSSAAKRGRTKDGATDHKKHPVDLGELRDDEVADAEAREGFVRVVWHCKAPRRRSPYTRG